MLDAHGIAYRYRDYRREPLSQAELRGILSALGASAGSLLRTNDRVARELGLTGREADADLLPLMAREPTLVARPIGVLGDRAVVGRPVERLLELAG